MHYDATAWHHNEATVQRHRSERCHVESDLTESTADIAARIQALLKQCCRMGGPGHEDRSRLVAGGLCIADVWLRNRVRHSTWRDSAVFVEGGAAPHAAEEFDRLWQDALALTWRRRTAKAPASPPPVVAGDVPVRVLAEEPGWRCTEQALCGRHRRGAVGSPHHERVCRADATPLVSRGLDEPEPAQRAAERRDQQRNLRLSRGRAHAGDVRRRSGRLRGVRLARAARSVPSPPSPDVARCLATLSYDHSRRP